MNALDYLLKANLYGLLFVGCYWLFLRRHTFFTLNRAYLLASAFLTLTLPLVTLPAPTVETLPVPVGVIALPAYTLAATPNETALAQSSPAQPGMDWEQVGMWAYGLIALGLLVRLAIQTRNLLQVIRRSPVQVHDDYALVEPNSPNIPTFSFFRYVVMNPADAHNDLILRHELVHVRQWHSVDVLSMAIARSIVWACPALWLIERALRQVHEFLADRAINQPSEYARFLVGYAFGIRPDTLANGFFNPSLLKQRIQMLHQRATSRWALGKYALIVPLALSLLAMTTAREKIDAVVSQVVDDKITVTGRVTGPDGKALAGAIVIVTETGEGTPTDRLGNYTLTNVYTSSRLAYSHIGYRTDVLILEAFSSKIRNGRLALNPQLQVILDELPPMGATAMYRAIKPNVKMPVRTSPSSQTINGQVNAVVEEPAVFPTGIPGLMQYVAHNLRYPAKAKAAGIEGDVYVFFTVLPTGAISGATVNQNIKSIGFGCREEAVRVVSQMPKWIPAQQNGKPVAVRYQLPIRFALEKKEDKRMGKVESIQKSTENISSRFALHTNALSEISLPWDSVPDRGPTIKVRGTGLSTGEPLYIIDGVQRLPKEGQPVPIDGLNPNDIESVEVIKNSSAMAVYGEKAKNGVILITTKKKTETPVEKP